MRVKSEEAVAYLLGELPAVLAEAFEASLFHDAARFEDTLAIEDELIDAFIRGELSVERRVRFEARYFATVEGRERIANAKTFHDRFRRAPGWMEWLKSLKPKRAKVVT
jgi:anti-sigma factor RsiW